MKLLTASRNNKPLARVFSCVAFWRHNMAFVLALLAISNPLSYMAASDTIVSFEDPKFIEDWAVVNDTVMGGVSRSRIEQTDTGNLLFAGELSLRNNGGFVSIRSRPSGLSLQNAGGIALRVRGDGRTYYLDLRAGGQMRGGSFRVPFTTLRNEWTNVFIPLSDFYAQSFGRVVRNVVLDPSSISSIGFTLSDKKPGVFRLEVESVKHAEAGSFDVSQPQEFNPSDQPRVLIELAIAKGVPLFNDGNEAACAAVYEIACTALLTMPGVSDASINRLRRALNEISGISSQAQRAWVLRYALDDTYQSLASSEVN